MDHEDGATKNAGLRRDTGKTILISSVGVGVGEDGGTPMDIELRQVADTSASYFQFCWQSIEVLHPRRTAALVGPMPL